MDIKVSISEGNSKMGRVAHINLPPVRTCDHNLPCYMGVCYAKKAYRQYPNVREAWDANWDMAENHRDDYFRQINEYLERRKPALFRWHSAGDIPDEDYLHRMFLIARYHKDVKFLVFTKKYDLAMTVADRRLQFRRQAPNLNIVISAWPYLPVEKKLFDKFPVAFMLDPRDPDERIPMDAKDCTGKCDECGLCWRLHPGESVKFHIH